VRSLWSLLLVLALVLLPSGCGDSDPRLAISGTVKFKGELLDQGRIEFHPPSNKGTMSGAGIQNGKYEIPRSTGLAPDTYEVRIFSYDQKGAKLDAMPGEPGLGFKERIARQYNLGSTLKAEVRSGNTTFDFSVE
jgi:hypothetical protein